MSAALRLREPIPDLAALFIRMYRVAASWRPEERSLASMDQPALDKAVFEILEVDDEQEALTRLRRYILTTFSNDDERGQFLAIMRSLDNLFQRIHPRLRVGGPLARDAARVPTWLRSMAERRLETGAYGSDDNFRLLPRGPLLRCPRREGAASADTMTDRFVALAVVCSTFDHDGRLINLTHRVITSDRLEGISGDAVPGMEHIVHIPMAVAPNELATEVTVRGRTHCFEFSFGGDGGGAGDADSDHAADRFLSAANDAPDADIVLAPEFVMPAESASEIGRRMAKNPLKKHRLVATGSGVSADRSGEMPWNEMQVFNGYGRLLWGQRKIWPAAVAAHVAEGVGHPLPDGCTGLEGTCSSDELLVVDVDTVGRCVILICQDIKLFPMNVLMNALQCDWVFVPILDTGVCEGRWTHTATFGLTEDSQTRFLVGSSLSLVRLLNRPADTPCLLAVGPRLPTETEDSARAFAKKSLAPNEQYVSLRWRDADWTVSVLTSEAEMVRTRAAGPAF